MKIAAFLLFFGCYSWGQQVSPKNGTGLKEIGHIVNSEVVLSSTSASTISKKPAGGEEQTKTTQHGQISSETPVVKYGGREREKVIFPTVSLANYTALSEINDGKHVVARKGVVFESRSFIVPLMGVIFALPMLAVVFYFSYKKCAEWKEHRHYRRMDFLIEGMYNY